MDLGVLAERLWESTGLVGLTPGNLVMIGVGVLLLYLAIFKKFEPLLLLPIGFGAILANLPFAPIMNPPTDSMPGGLLYYLHFGVEKEIFPPLIFLGVGAMTDFGPLLANPSTLLLGAAAQLGIFIAMLIAKALGFSISQAAAIGIIGGADGPTAIYTAMKLAPELLGPIAVAAYTYMSLVPLIQPPIMRALTTPKERSTVMSQLREVSRVEKIIFPIVVTVIVSLLLPPIAPLVGMLMLGNLFRECGVVDRLSKTAANELNNIIVIFLATSVGATMSAENFLKLQTIEIIALGLVAFAGGTAGGVLLGKLMYYVTGGKVNPLIGSAGVSAVPMAARVSQVVGQKENPQNFLLMHAMGPNVAGVIGTAVVAGVMLALLLK
ncbi:MAG: sodium ion-translocating decarboxylase subunit beta [Candidatus Fermentithermobacillus carboniphilus]|uniref:Sodium ion-translocating decarboxylase subunit beta n=1 Tax=Candidatus Fermentithermobacillus carboniphilus TaxID=3085328 RepID=A0AAT9LAL3_9FIRM|nr:MAG: sodium ion-translocating decarboxylase subunit beta [Candidatus Fermentithermobacillus carboniphilus]